MNEETRHILKWGWLRMILGTLQITLVPLCIIVLFALGINDGRTWALIILTTLITGISRMLYGGRSDPKISRK